MVNFVAAGWRPLIHTQSARPPPPARVRPEYRAMGLARDAPHAELGRASREALVAESVGEYVALAARLGADPVFREASRRRICARKRRLFDDAAPVGEWARFIRTAVAVARAE